MPPDDGAIRLDQGVNFSDTRTDLLPGELSRARNCFYQPERGILEKISGRSLFAAAGPGPIKGLWHISFRDGTRLLIAASGTGYYTAPGGGGSFTLRKDFGSGATLGRMMAVYQPITNLAYLFDGVNPAQVLQSNGTIRAAGLLAPTSAMTATVLGNGATLYAQGSTFSYCMTEYDPTNLVESGPGPVLRTQTNVTGDTLKLALPNLLNPGATVTKFRVYRTEDGGDVFFRIAEIAATNRFYYDGQNTDAGAPAVDNSSVWGFYTVDDIFLGAQPVLAMIGSPITSNYVTVNGKIPLGNIIGAFQDCTYVAGVPGFPQDLYYSMPREPEQFSPVYVLREPDDFGSPIVGAGVANDRLIVFNGASMWRHDQFPFVTDPGFGLSTSSRIQIAGGTGAVARDSIVNFGVSQPNNRLFYLSPRGPSATDGYTNLPLGEDLRWTSEWFNPAAIQNAIARNYAKHFQIWLFLPSRSSTVNDLAWIYHYHPSHQKENGLGKWTGPIDVRANAAATAIITGQEPKLYVGDSQNGNVFTEDAGNSDAQLNLDGSGNIAWEWETGDHSLGRATRNKRVKRVFLTSEKSAGSFPSLTAYMNEGNTAVQVPMEELTDTAEPTQRFGTSTIATPKTRTYRGGLWKTGRRVRLALSENSVIPRNVSSVALEVEDFGEQR